MLDITPQPSLLRSIRADKAGSYWTLLAEVVDNSLDAGARNITLQVEEEFLQFIDDGVGITKGRQSALVTLGEHASMPSTNLGRFGVGMKYNGMCAGNVLKIASVSRDGSMSLHANWADVERHNRWEIEDPVWKDAGSRPTGTTIKIEKLLWRKASGKDIKQASAKLAMHFYPALTNGVTILLNGEPVPILKEPKLRKGVDTYVRLNADETKGAHVRGGLIEPTPGGQHGVQLSYKHRVIKANDQFGCGGYSGLTGMFARVDLIGSWKLGRFKGELAPEEHADEDELAELVLDVLEPILKQCQTAHMSAKIQEIETMLNDMLPDGLAAARPKKNAAKEKREVKPKNSGEPGGITRNGTPDGPARKPHHRQQLLITFDDYQDEEFGFGHYMPGRPGRVVLALDNPDIKDLLAVRDSKLGARSLLHIALFLYVHERSNQQLELGLDGSYGLQVSQLARLTESQSVGVA